MAVRGAEQRDCCQRPHQAEGGWRVHGGGRGLHVEEADSEHQGDWGEDMRQADGSRSVDLFDMDGVGHAEPTLGWSIVHLLCSRVSARGPPGCQYADTYSLGSLQVREHGLYQRD